MGAFLHEISLLSCEGEFYTKFPLNRPTERAVVLIFEVPYKASVPDGEVVEVVEVVGTSADETEEKF